MINLVLTVWQAQSGWERRVSSLVLGSLIFSCLVGDRLVSCTHLGFTSAAQEASCAHQIPRVCKLRDATLWLLLSWLACLCVGSNGFLLFLVIMILF